MNQPQDDFASLQLDASAGLSVAAGDRHPGNPPNHPTSQAPRKGLEPRLVPHDVLATASTATLATLGHSLWLVGAETPSQGKLWNLRSAVLLTTDSASPISISVGTYLQLAVFKLSSGQRQNGQAVAGTEPQPDIVSRFCGVNDAIGAVEVGFSRYEEWVRPGEYLAGVVNGSVVLAGTGQMTVRFKIDQYDETDILPRWQG